MKKNKKKILLIISVTILLVLVSSILYFFISSRNSNSLTLEENKWIDANKYNVIDVGVINDIPVLSYDGKGIVYNYLDYVSEKHSLKFNVIPYKLDNSIEYNYKVDIVSNPSEKDIILLKDNLVYISIDNKEFYDVKDIVNFKIGILSSDKELLSSYFSNNNIEFVEYSSYNDLKNSFTQSKSNEQTTDTIEKVDGIIIPKTIFTKEIVENNYKVSFQLNNLNKYFILKTNGSTELNNILKKDYNVWKNLNYEKSYNDSLLNNYFEFKGVSDTDQKRLQSKSYVYGFIDYGIYNNLDNNKISGLNGLILTDFNKFSGLSITYTKYNSINKLLEDFNAKEVDFMLNIANSYNTNVYNTVGVFNKELVVVSGISNNVVVDGIYSLKNKQILTIKDSYLEKYLIENGIKVKSYNNMDDLTTDFSTQDIAIIDLENYNYYKTSDFEDCKINYIMNLDEKYNYVINDNDDNAVFKEIFNFYINYNSIDYLVYSNYDDIAYENINIAYILIIIIIILSVYIAIDFSNHLKFMMKSIKKNNKIRLTKEEKMKYIDQLTSLKNRAYLNSRIESWDESEIYPQSIIVIDLNNVSYINDNYGREEGDKVITEAANVLIQHQLQNSEIIRTDGNEFLIYLVGYSEKQIISYLRKLNKEFKHLSHGFGAASGYSIITDAIKTIDDAVNEATLDMKNNKEDIDY